MEVTGNRALHGRRVVLAFDCVFEQARKGSNRRRRNVSLSSQFATQSVKIAVKRHDDFEFGVTVRREHIGVSLSVDMISITENILPLTRNSIGVWKDGEPSPASLNIEEYLPSIESWDRLCRSFCKRLSITVLQNNDLPISFYQIFQSLYPPPFSTSIERIHHCYHKWWSLYHQRVTSHTLFADSCLRTYPVRRLVRARVKRFRPMGVVFKSCAP